MADKVRDELAGSLKSILETGEYSDLVISCGNDSYNVHKAVVCARSGFFKRCQRFPGKESEEGKINLPEDEPEVIQLLIKYLYHGEYDPKLPDGEALLEATKFGYTGPRLPNYHFKFPHTCATQGCTTPDVCIHHKCGRECDSGYGSHCEAFVCRRCCPNTGPIILSSPDGDAEQLLLHAKMYEIADKYNVTGLKKLAREKFWRVSNEYWDTEHFVPAARYAFSTTPDHDKGLRDIISKVISQHMALLNRPAIEALLTEFNGLAFGLLKMRAKDLGWMKT